MGAISTTTFSEPLGYPNQQYIERENFDGDLWFAKRTSQTQVDIYKSSDNGASWSGPIATYSRTNLQEISGLFMDSNGHIHMLARVYESGTDRVFYNRLAAGATSFDTEQLVVGAATGAAGNVYTGMDLCAFKLSNTFYIHMAVGTHDGTNGGFTIFSATWDSTYGFRMNNRLVSGARQWLNGPDGIVHPTITFENTGDGKTTNGSPALWVAWGRATIYTARFTWVAGPTWQSPAGTPPAVSSLSPSQPSNTAIYDPHGSRFIVAFPTGSVVRLAEKNVDNTAQTQRDTPTHPAGTVKHCAISVSSATSNNRVFAVGTTDSKLYYTDYARDADTWSAWTAVSASAIVGATSTSYTVRRVNFGNGHFDLAIATGSSPYNLISTSSTASSAPKTPALSSPPNGVAQDVNTTLSIAWNFTADDPSETQDAYALRRVIGASTTYWNASTSSWGASEVFNSTGTTGVTLASGWGATTDANHFYAVKVRGSISGLSTNYSAQAQVQPSAKDNPTITSPSGSPTTALITVAWTVATQSQYRITLTKSGVLLRDTGWVTSTATSVLLPDQLLAQTYVVSVQTKNSKGLASNIATQTFTPSYTPPAATTPTVAAFNSLGIVRATFTNPDPVQPQPLVASNTIYRRVIGDTGPGVPVGTTPSSTPVNLVAAYYGGFEATNSSDNWGTAGSNSTAARDTSQANNGLACFAETSTAGNGFDGINFGPLNTFAAAPGDTFYLEFYVKGTAGRVVKGQVGWRTAANGPNNVPSSGPNLTLTGAWQKYSMTSGAAPSNTAFAYPTLGVVTGTVGTGEKLYNDDVVFYKTGSSGTPRTYDDFTAASGVAYEYSVVTTGVNGAVTQSAWVS